MYTMYALYSCICVNARTILCDARETLLELNEDDVDELAQATLIVAKISMSYATAAHKQLADTLGVPVVAAPAPAAIEQQPTETSDSTDASSGKKGKARSQVCVSKRRVLTIIHVTQPYIPQYIV
jgi:hypothetical protein